MARLDRMTEEERKHLLSLPCPAYASTPWTTPPSMSQCRIALISTAGLHRRDDRPFEFGATDYRVIPADIEANDLIMSHVSANFDRTGFEQDWNVIFPIDRLKELAEKQIIGSVASYHYSFMGATEPQQMEATARDLAQIMKKDGVNAVLLVPV